MRSPSETPFTAVVLAADRTLEDPVAQAAGVCCKAFAPVRGTPMVLRVLQALAESRETDTRILCGPGESQLGETSELRRLIDSGDVKWLSPKATPSTSAYAAMDSLAPETPLLLTTSDHALLSPRIVDHFCREARATGADVVVGLARHEVVRNAYPEVHRTVVRLRDGGYCGCNLFAFLTPQSRLAAAFWHRVESHRKKPLRVVSVLGWLAILRFLMGRLSAEEALTRISRRMGVHVDKVIMPFPEAAVDVDTVADWHFAQRQAAAKAR